MLSNIIDLYKRNQTIINYAAIGLAVISIIGKKIMDLGLSKSDFWELVNGKKLTYPTKSIRKLSSGYGTRRNPFSGATSYHNGIDIPAPAKTPIFAPIDGEVIVNSYHAQGGNQLVLTNGDIRLGFAHLFEKPNFQIGDKIKKGTQIGLIGTTGTSTGNHLHFTLKVDGNFVDPKKAFPNYV